MAYQLAHRSVKRLHRVNPDRIIGVRSGKTHSLKFAYVPASAYADRLVEYDTYGLPVEANRLLCYCD